MIKQIINYFLRLFYPLFRRFMPYMVYAYLAVGAINTLLNILLYAWFYLFIIPKSGLVIDGFTIASYTISLVLAFLITVPTGFWLAKTFAFEEAKKLKDDSAKKLGKYFLVVLQGLGSEYLILTGLIIFLNLDPTVAKFISTAIVLTFNYFLQKHFTFKNASK
ncbi:putative flippase GtrA [Pedobacter cryoconitis]|uniref:Putative flippase GtrA n=1 Tax=Pedobacter cryoconitis TaxID=188932 RepID=A0A7W9DXK2_9SPHI|nr:GtrA family protein [Pedobacter cryoconitis]MBB5634971.1 putative flippase GtrA [Pedobacter cryoconitis]